MAYSTVQMQTVRWNVFCGHLHFRLLESSSDRLACVVAARDDPLSIDLAARMGPFAESLFSRAVILPLITSSDTTHHDH